MTSVVPERAARALEVVQDVDAPTRAPDTRWQRTLARRLVLLDSAVVAVTARGHVLLRSMLDSETFPLPGASDIELTSYLVIGPLLAVAWVAMLAVTRTYDGRVLGVGGDEYRRVARASVYFWGLVAIASYMIQFELSRFVLAVAFVAGTLLLLVGRWGARKVLHHARRPLQHVVPPGPRGRWARGGGGPGRRAASASRTPATRWSAPACPPGDAAEGLRRVPVVGSFPSVPEAVAASASTPSRSPPPAG